MRVPITDPGNSERMRALICFGDKGYRVQLGASSRSRLNYWKLKKLPKFRDFKRKKTHMHVIG